MFIPMDTKISNDAQIQEGKVEKICKICNGRFAVPEQDADNYKVCVCEDCQPAYDQQVAAASAALMKDPSGAAEAIKTALGS